MTERSLLFQIVFNYLFAGLFFFFLVDIWSTYGFGLLALLSALIATRDFVHGTRLLIVYRQIKKDQNKKD